MWFSSHLTTHPIARRFLYTGKSAQLLLFHGLISLAFIAATGVVTRESWHSVTEAAAWVDRSQTIQQEIESTLSFLKDAETGQRGFLLTGREEFLEPYHSSVAQFPSHFRLLRDLVADDPGQLKYIADLEPLIQARMQAIVETIRLRREGEHESAISMVKDGYGKAKMDEIRRVMDTMEWKERQKLEARQQKLQESSRRNKIVSLAMVALDIVFLSSIAVLLMRLRKLEQIVTICAWSKTILYEGEWLSFEDYLARQFNIRSSHGISPAEMEKILAEEHAKMSGAK